MLSNTTKICEEAEQVVLDGGSKLDLILSKKNIRWRDTGLKCISYVLSSFRNTGVVFDDYPDGVTTIDNALFQDKKDALLSSTANKHCAINVILIELEKPGCKTFHLHDDANIDISKLSVQSFFEMSDN